jgi:tryptophanyl-tRNA synthetase
MKRILSGMQPTGNLHLGNYLGALKNWVSLQHDYESFFFMPDLHALTVHPDPVQLKRYVLEGTAWYLAAGIDPAKSTLFVQSSIPAHTELMWILSCSTPTGWLNRMIQFKEKAGSKQENANLGLYAYPVLQAADILVYKATHVPIGEDQKQHVELTREIAQAFNRRYGQGILVIPEPQIFGAGTRVMGLKDGTKKMSKSDPAEGSRINLLDDPDRIMKKIRKATTDTAPFPETIEGAEGRPEVKNLINIYSALSGDSLQNICHQFGDKNFSEFKQALVTVCIESLSPIREKFLDLMKSPDHVEKILKEGALKANEIANSTLQDVKKSLGIR